MEEGHPPYSQRAFIEKLASLSEPAMLAHALIVSP